MAKRKGILPIILTAAIFILMEVAALNMLSRNGKMQNLWIARAGHVFMSKTWGTADKFTDYFALKEQNRLLAEENFQLAKRLRYFEERENSIHLDTLTEGIRLNGKTGFNYNSATVVKNSRNRQHNYIIINKGSDDGIGTRAGIITSKGVVGIIDAVSPHYSYALSFRNSDLSISARLGNEGAVGPLTWDGHSTNGAILKEIPLQYKFQPGDTVWTSGYSSIFPANIPLGIAGESRIVNGATNEIRVKLFQDFKTIRYVTIVENRGLEEIEQLEAKEAQNKK